MKPFKEAFCQHHGCSSKDYSCRVFFTCAVERKKLLLILAWFWEPSAVIFSKRCIEEIGSAKSLDELEDILTEYRHLLHDFKLAHSGFRLSSNSLQEVFKQVLGISVADS